MGDGELHVLLPPLTIKHRWHYFGRFPVLRLWGPLDMPFGFDRITPQQTNKHYFTMPQ